MNPGTMGNARKLFLDIRERIGKARMKSPVTVAVAPPYPFIGMLAELSPTHRIELSAQDVSAEPTGAHTGEVSVSMLKSLGVQYVIVGHSERRAHGERDEEIGKKLTQVLKARMHAILCVGEKARDKAGNFFSEVERQLAAALAGIPQGSAGRFIVAYEPVWAIGSGKHAEPEDAYEMKLFIRKVLTDKLGRAAAERVRIIYGGSVNRTNAEALLSEGQVDGFLVGGASLRASDFAFIIQAARDAGKKDGQTS